jgi:hypothetical protein
LDDSLGRLGTRTFVTVLGWVLIGFTGLGVLSMLLQTFFFTVMFAMPEVPSQPAASGAAPGSPAFRTFLGLLLAFSILVLASAVAFLKRKNWARRTFVMLFTLAILFNAVALVLLVVVTGRSVPPALGPADGGRFDAMARLMLIPAGIVAVGCSLVFGWLIKRLTSAPVRAEFQDREAF